MDHGSYNNLPHQLSKWLKTVPGAFNDTGDVPVIRCGNGHVGESGGTIPP